MEEYRDRDHIMGVDFFLLLSFILLLFIGREKRGKLDKNKNYIA